MEDRGWGQSGVTAVTPDCPGVTAKSPCGAGSWRESDFPRGMWQFVVGAEMQLT